MLFLAQRLRQAARHLPSYFDMCCLDGIKDVVVRTLIHPPTPPQRNPSNGEKMHILPRRMWHCGPTTNHLDMSVKWVCLFFLDVFVQRKKKGVDDPKSRDGEHWENMRKAVWHQQPVGRSITCSHSCVKFHHGSLVATQPLQHPKATKIGMARRARWGHRICSYRNYPLVN